MKIIFGKPFFFILMLALSVFLFQGCTGKQANQISDMSVDAIMLDDAVNAQKDEIATYIDLMTPEKQKEVLAAMETLDDVQLKIKALISMEDFSNIAPAKILSTYMDAKGVADALRKNLYDEANDFVVWNKIPVSKQIQLVNLSDQSSELGDKIEKYIEDPDNGQALDIAKTVSTYGYLALKILTVAAAL